MFNVFGFWESSGDFQGVYVGLGVAFVSAGGTSGGDLGTIETFFLAASLLNGRFDADREQKWRDRKAR